MNANLKTMKWLIKREFWENKGMFFWSPLVIGLLLSLMTFSWSLKEKPWEKYVKQASAMAQGLYPNMYVGDRSIAAMSIVDSYLVVATPILFVMGVMATFYLMGALLNDRQDKSILFWKSMPVSETQTVLSKIIFSIVVVPLISFAVGFICYLFFSLLMSFTFLYHGYNVFPSVYSNVNMILTPLKILSIYPTYFLWALPSIGWFLLVSSWTKSRAFPWAIGLPLLIMIMIMIMIKVTLGLEEGLVISIYHAILNLLTGLIPGSWVMDFGVPANVNVKTPEMNLSYYQVQGYLVLSSLRLWVGVFVSVVLIACAIQFRKRHSDI